MQVVSHHRKEEGFNALYKTTRNGLFHFLHRYTTDVHLIEDIMQQCYLKIWERMDVLQRPEDMQPLVQTYARNLLIDVIRKRMKEDTRWLEQLEQETESIMDASTSASGKQLLQQLDSAIEQLPAQTRMVYLLHRENRLSYKAIALRLCISVSMVEKHMSRAIAVLKREMLKDIVVVVCVGELILWGFVCR